MALTRDFKDTIRARAQADEAFRAAMLMGAVEALLAGDLETGKAVLRDFINATIGFEALAASVGKQSKTLMQMFGAKGNPTAANLFLVIDHLQKATGVRLAVHAA